MKQRIFWYLAIYTAITAIVYGVAALHAPEDVAVVFMAFITLAIPLLGVCNHLATRLAHSIAESVNNIDPTIPLQCDVFEEFTPLLRNLYSQQLLMVRQVNELSRRKLEFDALSGGMNEGLIILDDHCTVLSCNPAAMHLLGAAVHDYTGTDILHLTRNPKLRKSALQSIAGEKIDYLDVRDDQFLQFYCSPLEENSLSRRGAVILILDVSAQHKAERSRREFTANVSHELKTPLTSVIGYTEMMKMGIVQPADMREFSARIHTEATHLLSLVDDIIKLSRLDENSGALAFEPIDLYSTAQVAIDRLQSKAQLDNITLAVTGQSCMMQGVPPLILDLITNLCDNAIKYNRPDGSVTEHIAPCFGGMRLTVTDTGYGIALADQAHVFERFYRAEKSRNRDVGGTGLGLSIAKHICELHKAQISLRSNDRGTTFTVDFLRKNLG